MSSDPCIECISSSPFSPERLHSFCQDHTQNKACHHIFSPCVIVMTVPQYFMQTHAELTHVRFLWFLNEHGTHESKYGYWSCDYFSHSLTELFGQRHFGFSWCLGITVMLLSFRDGLKQDQVSLAWSGGIFLHGMCPLWTLDTSLPPPPPPPPHSKYLPALSLWVVVHLNMYTHAQVNGFFFF